MTHEEAGQIILEGPPWIPCRRCAGKGEIAVSYVKAEDCQVCFTRGYLLRLKAREAWRVAGLELPPKPYSAAEMTNAAKKIVREQMQKTIYGRLAAYAESDVLRTEQFYKAIARTLYGDERD